MQTYFSTNPPFRVVETEFMAGTNHKRFFRLVEIHFLTNPSFHLLEKDFFFIPSTLLESSLLLAKTVTDMSGNHFLKTDLILLVETHFLTSGNQEVLHPG